MSPDWLTSRDYRLRVVAFYRARAGDSLDCAKRALEAGQGALAGFHLEEAQAWAQFAAGWARKVSDAASVEE